MVGDASPAQSDTGFAVVRRGYDQAQVDSHLARLDAEVRILSTDRLAAVDQATHLTRELDESRARTDRLRAQVRTLVSPPQSVQGMSERMRSMLRMAEDEVAEMHSDAEAEIHKRLHEADLRAAQVVADAQAEADALVATARADSEKSAQEISRMRAELDAERQTTVATLAAERADIDRRVHAVVGDAERERAAAWAESEHRREQVEEDFRIAMNQRRSEALAALTAERLAGRHEIEERRRSAAAAAVDVVAQAQAKARGIVADAEHRIIELTALRRRIVEQLGGTRAVLERTVGDLGPLPEELDAQRRENEAPDTAELDTPGGDTPGGDTLVMDAPEIDTSGNDSGVPRTAGGGPTGSLDLPTTPAMPRSGTDAPRTRAPSTRHVPRPSAAVHHR